MKSKVFKAFQRNLKSKLRQFNVIIFALSSATLLLPNTVIYCTQTVFSTVALLESSPFGNLRKVVIAVTSSAATVVMSDSSNNVILFSAKYYLPLHDDTVGHMLTTWDAAEKG